MYLEKLVRSGSGKVFNCNIGDFVLCLEKLPVVTKYLDFMDAKMNLDECVGLGSDKVVNTRVLMFTLRMNPFYFKNTLDSTVAGRFI